MRRAIAIIISLLIMAILVIILNETIQGGLRLYIAYLDWPSFVVDFTLGIIIAIIIALLYFLLVRSWLRNKLLLVQGIITGIVTVIFFYLFSAVANGITVRFAIPPILMILRIFALGFIYPFLITWIGGFLKPLEKQKV